MTAYFDRRAQQLDRMRARWAAGDHSPFVSTPPDPGDEAYHDFGSPLERWERDLLRDVQLCATLPGFPADLRDAVQAAIARHGSDPLECQCSFSCPDDADEVATFTRLHYLCGDLHTIFHEVGRVAQGAEPGSDASMLSDKPDSILNNRAARECDRRFALLRADPGWADRMRQYDEWVARMQGE